METKVSLRVASGLGCTFTLYHGPIDLRRDAFRNNLIRFARKSVRMQTFVVKSRRFNQVLFLNLEAILLFLEIIIIRNVLFHLLNNFFKIVLL